MAKVGGSGERFTVLGLDPALATFGHGVVQVRKGVPYRIASGVFATGAKVPMLERVQAITAHVNQLIATYEPDAVSAEAFVWYGAGAGAGTHVMRVCGAIAATCWLRQRSLTEYQARAIKQSVTGSSNGEKDAVRAAVAAALRLDAWPATSHEADALGAALTHIARLRENVIIATRGGDTFGNLDNAPKPPKKRKTKTNAEQRPN